MPNSQMINDGGEHPSRALILFTSTKKASTSNTSLRITSQPNILENVDVTSYLNGSAQSKLKESSHEIHEGGARRH